MLDEQAVDGISGLENVEQILLRYLSISSNYERSTAFYKLILSIHQWAENQYPSIVEACNDILHSPECIAAFQDGNEKEYLDELLMN